MIRKIVLVLSLILVSLGSGLLIGVTKNAVQWEMVVTSLYSIAQKSYLKGCLDQYEIRDGMRIYTTCEQQSQKYLDDLKNSLENVSDGKSN